MAVLPTAMRPALALQRNAVRKGIFGRSNLWRSVAMVLYGRRVLKRLLGRQPEFLGRRTLRAGQMLTVAVLAPTARREARRFGISRASLTTTAQADVDAAQRAS